MLIGFYQKELRENKTGSAIPHLNKKLFSGLPLPIMPINRQFETANIVEKQFALLDKITGSLN